MKIIVGLGNPGEQYKKTRHNAGLLILDDLIDELGLEWKSNRKFQAQICSKGDIFFVKPETYMNNSGQSVEAIMAYYKLLPKKLVLLKEKNSDLSNILTIIHDDKDIELGKYKISIDSRSAGHNGVESIIKHLKTKNFRRIRIGIKTDLLHHVEAKKFVLQRFDKNEMEIIKNISSNIIKEIKKDFS